MKNPLSFENIDNLIKDMGKNYIGMSRLHQKGGEIYARKIIYTSKKAIFQEIGDFGRAKFYRRYNIIISQFRGNTILLKTRFSGLANFSVNITFKKGAYFSDAILCKIVRFYGCNEKQEIDEKEATRMRWHESLKMLPKKNSWFDKDIQRIVKSVRLLMPTARLLGTQAVLGYDVQPSQLGDL